MKNLMNGVILCLALMWVSSPWKAQAATPGQEPALTPISTLPWVRGVTLEKQNATMEPFLRGNKLLRESKYSDATKEYFEALKHWDHPAIHYNLVLALVHLDRPVEVYEHLDAAMRYGHEPLGEERYNYAQTTKKILDTQVVQLQLVCDQADVTVKLDGEIVIKGPGRYEARVRAGPHSITATKRGYETTDESMTIFPGQPVKVDIKLYTKEELTRYRRRWATWVPWSVLGSGLTVAATGGLFRLSTRAKYNAYDTGIRNQCSNICTPASKLLELRTQGDRLQKMSWGAYAVGGGALATGAVLLFINRAQPYRIDLDRSVSMEITPLVGSTNGLQATIPF